MLQEHIKRAQCSRSMSKYAPGAVYIQIMFLEHMELRISPPDYSCSGSMLLEQLFLKHLLLEQNFRAKISQKQKTLLLSSCHFVFYGKIIIT